MPAFEAVPNDDGGWIVAMHQIIVQMGPDNIIFVPGIKRILTISKSGGLQEYAVPE